MKMLTVSVFVCAMMALTRATPLPETEDEPVTQEIMVDPLPETEDEPVTQDIMVDLYTDGDIWTPVPTPVIDEPWLPSCPDGWTTFSIRCLRYVAESMTWDEAQENCRSMDGNLVFVGDAESFDDVHELIQSAGDNSGNIWVGGCDTEDLSWSWSFYDWTSDEREHFCFQPSGENVSGCLNEMQCDSHLPSVCSVILM
ncbi:type-2 ice-structuring protein-like isoform X2 [Siniperca chuatsi]|uniref:type-2 ice-structuring protein-like isoform X2 n=1 Tax=Siniperca chuatsi TaxID=119488 RepID=UPI001CE1AAE7|nr:type-2 ice-structuring protein-like isoform X2 [Siniperca chuatsi]